MDRHWKYIWKGLIHVEQQSNLRTSVFGDARVLPGTRRDRTQVYGDRGRRERQAVAAFAKRVNAHGDLRGYADGTWPDAMSVLQTRLDVLTAMKDLARS